MPLEDDKLEVLRRWGKGLRDAGGEEHAAVGRAILMLVEEIDRLHIELWHARMQPTEEEVAPTDATSDATAEDDEPVVSGLQARLQKVLRREVASDPVEPIEQPALDAEPVTTESAQAWIAALRRQK